VRDPDHDDGAAAVLRAYLRARGARRIGRPAMDHVAPTARSSGRATRPQAGCLARSRTWLALTRPRILPLILLMVPCASALDRGRWPGPALLAVLLAGTGALAAGASALNAWWERDRDARMSRTRGRPLPAGQLAPRHALALGGLLSALGLSVLWSGAGATSALLGGAALVQYLVVYTIWLKPRSPWSTVAGAVSGAAPALIADAAVDGHVGLWGLVVFAIVFLWQPPHVWAIGLYRREEYAAAGFPILPVVRDAAYTRRRMLAWSVVLLPVTLLPSLLGPLGWLYGATAGIGATAYVVSIAWAQRVDCPAGDRRVFTVSRAMLSLLCVAMASDLGWR